MKRVLLVTPFFILSLWVNAQTITSFAGGGTVLGDRGPATVALIADPSGCVFDKQGNFYVVSALGGNRIRKIDTSGIITTFAGTGAGGYSGDGGQATVCKLNLPVDIALDSVGNIYISDAENNAVRKINISTGIISTICGNGTSGSAGDGGPASSAHLYDPNGICFDKYGNLYIADLENQKVRKIDNAGIITTFAGTGINGFSGDGGPASAAQLQTPVTVTCDDTGNIYISDQYNARIRKVNRSGIISTFAGNGTNVYIGDGMSASTAQFSPDWIRMDNTNNLYIGDNVNYRVLKIDNSGIIHNIAGDGAIGFSGDGGPATGAAIYYPSGLAFDACWNLYIGDVNNKRVRKVAFYPTCSVDSLDSVATLSVNPLALNAEISIFPNPSYDELTIGANNKIKEVTLCNVVGQVVYSQTYDIEKAEVNVAGLPPGVYVVRVRDGGGNVVVRKVVKE